MLDRQPGPNLHRTTSGIVRRRAGVVATAVIAAIANPVTADEISLNEVVIELDDEAVIDDVVLPTGVTVLDGFDSEGLYLLLFPRPVTDADIFLLEADPAVDDADRDREQDLAGGQTQGVFYDSIESDQLRQYGWGLVRPAGAWRVTAGSGVMVALLDTGIDAAHPMLAGAIAPGGRDFIDGDGDPSDVQPGVDTDGDGAVDEMAGHGTMIAGVIRHIAPDATILPVRILDSNGIGSGFRIAAGIYHAIDQGADVINLSLGSTEELGILADAIEAATLAGVTVVTAGGNEGAAMPVFQPAGDPATIAVTATDAADMRAGFASFGPHVTLSAPGVDVISSFPGGGYRGSEGTSLSAAFVTGAAALVKAAQPTAGPVEITAALVGGAADISVQNPGSAGQLGAGRLDIASSFGAGQLADIDGDGAVTFLDLLEVLGNWGPCAGCPADIDADWSIGFPDLTSVLAAF